MLAYISFVYVDQKQQEMSGFHNKTLLYNSEKKRMGPMKMVCERHLRQQRNGIRHLVALELNKTKPRSP